LSEEKSDSADNKFERIFSEKNVAGMFLFICSEERVKESQLREIVTNYYVSLRAVNKRVSAGLVRT